MCRLTQVYSRKMKKKFCGAPTWRLLIRSILVHVFQFHFCREWLASLHYVWLPVLYPTTHPVGVDIKTFAVASLLLIQPLEDFFNSVFVMAVSLKCPWKTSVVADDDYPCCVPYWWCISCTGRRESSQQPASAAEKDWEFAQGNCRPVSFTWVLAGWACL